MFNELDYSFDLLAPQFSKQELLEGKNEMDNICMELIVNYPTAR